MRPRRNKPVNVHTGRRQADSKGRVIDRHQGMDPRAPSLTASWQAAAGAPQQRAGTKPALFESLGQSDGPYCQGAKNAFVDLKEGDLARAMDELTRPAAAAVLQRQQGGELEFSANEVEVLQALAGGGAVTVRRFSFEAYDINITALLCGQDVAWGVALCKEQWGVLHGGLGMLWGRSMRVFDRDALAACDAVEQLSESERCQAAQLATRAGGGRFMNVRDIPAYDSLAKRLTACPRGLSRRWTRVAICS